jgi:hypothetical protein
VVPAQSIATPSPLTTSAILLSGRGILKGWAFRETTGAAVATLNLWDGTANNGLMVAPLGLASAGHESIWLGELGVSFTRGLFLEVIAGSVVGALWVVPQEILTVDGADFAYATAPSVGGYPSLGIQELE